MEAYVYLRTYLLKKINFHSVGFYYAWVIRGYIFNYRKKNSTPVHEKALKHTRSPSFFFFVIFYVTRFKKNSTLINYFLSLTFLIFADRKNQIKQNRIQNKKLFTLKQKQFSFKGLLLFVFNPRPGRTTWDVYTTGASSQNKYRTTRINL